MNIHSFATALPARQSKAKAGAHGKGSHLNRSAANSLRYSRQLFHV